MLVFCCSPSEELIVLKLYEAHRVAAYTSKLAKVVKKHFHFCSLYDHYTVRQNLLFRKLCCHLLGLWSTLFSLSPLVLLSTTPYTEVTKFVYNVCVPFDGWI